MFVNLVATHFERKVKHIRSDNAMEFDDVKCRDFFAKLGVSHQTSYTNRSQHNGRVERKHLNILEMARALRFQAGLPPSYWGDCVLIATHLINRLPTPILHNKTPYEVLFNKKT